MKTIAKIEEELVTLLRQNIDEKYPDIINELLSYVIGEEETSEEQLLDGRVYKRIQHKHPITIRDAIERVK